jgi:general secretion pathway protein B
MSFILDALKKSESDRQRQSGPSLFEVKVAPPRRRLPIWAAAIAVLLGINVIVISWMLLRHPAASQPAAAPPQASPATVAPGREAIQAPAGPAAATPPVPAPAASGQAAPSAQAPAPVNARPPAPSAGGSGQATPAAAVGGTGRSASSPSGGDNPGDYAPAVEPTATARSTTGDLPLYQQIVTSDGLPALHLDLHVFANRPKDRFVMINMHRLGEGDSLPSGVHVDAIRPDGVVLTYRGDQFLLPRN